MAVEALMGSVLMQQASLANAEGEDVLREAVENQEAVLGPSHPLVIATTKKLAYHL